MTGRLPKVDCVSRATAYFSGEKDYGVLFPVFVTRACLNNEIVN